MRVARAVSGARLGRAKTLQATSTAAPIAAQRSATDGRCQQQPAERARRAEQTRIASTANV